ncbi:MAG: hypothetical protein WCT16_02125 [Candidatus Buchananbacteria bacterium]
MHERKILELLARAADKSAKCHERQIILQELLSALMAKRAQLVDKDNRVCVGCLQKIVSELYSNCLKHCPEELPRLFPIFALICGNSSNSVLLSEIDWQLYKTMIDAPEKH